MPQFTYGAHCQTADAIDRVLSHCAEIRQTVSLNRRSIHKSFSGQGYYRLAGGLQLSLDLTKAYDYLPRHLLLAALQRIGAPGDLQRLIMFIHDNALLVLTKHTHQTSVRMGRGVRQGCGLSPQLWLAFTVLFFDKATYLPANSVTGFADDFHVQWTIKSARDFHTACGHIPRILSDLNSLGMQVSMDKTVTLLALTGPDAPKLLKTYTAHTPQGRILKIDHPTHPTCLPIKKQHTYLAVVISYKLFERSTLKHRQQLAWQAFHRLKKFLTSNHVTLKRRVLLWQTCVLTILQYGLTSVGVDDTSATQLRGTVMRQLRCIAKSLGHLTHETNTDLLQRLGIPDPIESLWRLCSKRVAVCTDHVGHLQPPRVHQWRRTVLAGLHRHADAPPPPAFKQPSPRSLGF